MRARVFPASVVLLVGLSACIPQPPPLFESPIPQVPSSSTGPNSAGPNTAGPNTAGNAPQPSPVAPLDVGSTAGAIAGANIAPSIPAGAIFVDSSAPPSPTGTADAPYPTISAAVSKAPAGSTIVVRGGVYHESVQVYSKALTIQSYPNENVVLDGASEISGWSPGPNGTWRADAYTSNSSVGINDKTIDPDFPLAARSEQLFLNGQALSQVATVQEVDETSFYIDTETSTVHVGIDPAENLIEQSDLEWGLYLNHAHGSTLRGLTVQRFATPPERIAAVRAYGDDIAIKDVVVSDNAHAGLSVIGSNVDLERISAIDNGQNGLHGNTADHLSLRNSRIQNNNSEMFAANWSAAAIKLTRSWNVTIEGNIISGNRANGVWFDQSCFEMTVARNRISSNSRSGIMVELSARAGIFGNMINDNDRYGVYILDSSEVSIEANSILNSSRGVYIVDGARNATDTSSSDHDRRHPVPNPQIPWESREIGITANVIGQHGSESAGTAVVSTEDVTRKKTTKQMGVATDKNVYWTDGAESTAFFSTWANYPASIITTQNFAQHQVKTGEDAESIFGSGDNPYVSGIGLNTSAVRTGPLSVTVSEAAKNALSLPSGTTAIGVPQEVLLPS